MNQEILLYFVNVVCHVCMCAIFYFFTLNVLYKGNAGLQMTVGHRTMADQNLLMSDEV